MLFGRESLYLAPKALPKQSHAFEGGDIGACCWGQDAHAPLEEVGAGILGALLFRPGERVGTDKADVTRQLRFEIADDVRLGAARVSEQGARLRIRGRGQCLFRDLIDRRAKYDYLRRANAGR